VVQECPSQDLPNLALVSLSFRSFAEPLLYTTIHVDVVSEWHGALGTLTTNATKARYVKFLAVEFDPDMRQHSIEASVAVVDHLVTALWNTTMLIDLRLRLHRSNEGAFTKLNRSLL
jgi:hypothetical protein